MVIEVSTKKIDVDTHFNTTVDYSQLKEMLPRRQNAELAKMMSRDIIRMMDRDSVLAAVAGAPEPGSHDGDPEGEFTGWPIVIMVPPPLRVQRRRGEDVLE